MVFDNWPAILFTLPGIGSSKDDVEAGQTRIGNKCFSPIEDVMVPFSGCPGSDAGHVRTCLGFRHRQSSECTILPADQGKVALLLSLIPHEGKATGRQPGTTGRSEIPRQAAPSSSVDKGNKDGKREVKECGKGDIGKDSCRIEKGDCCQKPLDLRIKLDDGSGVYRRMGSGQQDEYPSWPGRR